MSAKRKPAQSPRIVRQKAPLEARVHTCLECPVCGTESCKTLQELGMYCETAIAAAEASRASWAEPPEKRKPAVA
jgi:hypothetical protein